MSVEDVIVNMKEKSERVEDFEEMLDQLDEEQQATVSVAEEVYGRRNMNEERLRLTNSTRSETADVDIKEVSE